MVNILISDSLKFAVEFTDEVIEEFFSDEESKTRLACDITNIFIPTLLCICILFNLCLYVVLRLSQLAHNVITTFVKCCEKVRLDQTFLRCSYKECSLIQGPQWDLGAVFEGKSSKIKCSSQRI